MLTTSYPRDERDASGFFVRGMARALVSRGHEIEILAPAPRTPIGAPSEKNIDVHWVDYAPPSLRRTFYGAGVPDNVRDPRAWPGLASFPIALARAARDRVRDWDAIVSHWALPCALVAGAVRAGRPHLAVLHSADVHLLRRLPPRRRWVRALASSADELLFASNALRKSLLDVLAPGPRARLAGRSHASAMGIEELPQTRPRRTLRRAHGLDAFTVLSLGRLVPIKGVEHAIEATHGLENVQLVVAGDGPSRSELEAHASRARFVGPRFGVEKAELLRAADVFVVPSIELPSGRTEGTPTAALEAALAGRPIIASRVAGLAEVFEHERSALLVPPGDSRALRSAILRLQEDAALRRRLGRAAKTVGKRYLWSALAPRLEELVQGA